MVFGVSQSTISRMVNALEEPIAAVLDCAAHSELYSGKRHRSGAAVQILSDTDGQLRHVGEPSPLPRRSRRTRMLPTELDQF